MTAETAVILGKWIFRGTLLNQVECFKSFVLIIWRLTRFLGGGMGAVDGF
jgi:hypothetical protein